MAWFLRIGLGLKWTYSGLIKKKDALAFRASSGLIKKKDALAFRASVVNLRYWYYTASVHPI